ncbi:MAG: FtsX-like permease family protein, partial [Thermoanaerobaculia bacterium]
EIGIRRSLGAQRKDVIRLVAAQGVRLTSIGILLGLVVAFALTRFLSSLLYGVDPLDPVTFVTASLLLAMTALTASYVPARRAVRINPVDTLRQL